jgi:hypothetical protein
MPAFTSGRVWKKQEVAEGWQYGTVLLVSMFICYFGVVDTMKKVQEQRCLFKN